MVSDLSPEKKCAKLFSSTLKLTINRTRRHSANGCIGPEAFEIQQASRMAIDKADIEGLMQICGDQLDWQRVADYFALFEMADLYVELKERHHGH